MTGKNRLNGFLTSILFAFILVYPNLCGATESFLDWKVRHLNLYNTASIFPGYPVNLECAWTAEVVDNGTMKGPIDWNGYISVDGEKIKVFEAKYPFLDSPYFKPEATPTHVEKFFGASNYGGTATNQFNGAVTAIWTAKGIGPHTAECYIAQMGTYTGETLSRRADNHKKLSFQVVQPPVIKEGQWPDSPKGDSSNPKALTKPKPKLVIHNVDWAVEPTCQNLNEVLKVKAQIRNLSSIMKPVKGFASVHEYGGGAYLKSPPVPLTGFENSQIITVELPVGVSPVYKSALPGPRKLVLYLKDALENGQPTFYNPNPTYEFSVTFPLGYCQPKAIAPSFPAREKR